MATYLEDIADRLIAMCKEAVPGSDATDDVFHVQERFPYWIAVLQDYPPAFNSNQYAALPYVFNLEYIIGHVTEGYRGQTPRRLLQDEPVIMAYFLSQRRRRLQSAAYPTELDDLDPIGISFRRSAGAGLIRRTGIGVAPFGTVFTITVPVHLTLEDS